MGIRNTTREDLPAVMEVYAGARQFMAANGNPGQWGAHYPPQAMIEDDIARGTSYLLEEGGRVAGVFYFAVEQDPTYNKIDGAWLNDAPYGVIHRIASGGGKGLLASCVDWCMERCGNLRIDTHHDNRVMQQALDKLGFVQCGVIHLEDGSPRLAYQKSAG